MTHPTGGYEPGPEQNPAGFQPQGHTPQYQPGMPTGGQPGYGQPPAAPPPQQGGNTGLIVVVVTLVLGVLVGGGALVFALSGDGDDSADDGDQSASSDTGPPSDGTDESQPPTATTATFAPPSSPWLAYGPWSGPSGGIADPTVHYQDVSDGWISAIFTGTLDQSRIAYDPNDLEGVAEQVINTFAEENITTVENKVLTDIVYTPWEIGGHDAVLAEVEVSWDESDSIPDTSEQTAVVVADINGTEAAIGLAAISESHSADYTGAVSALSAITFS